MCPSGNFLTAGIPASEHLLTYDINGSLKEFYFMALLLKYLVDRLLICCGLYRKSHRLCYI